MTYSDMMQNVNLLKAELSNVDEEDFNEYKKIIKEIKRLETEAKKIITPWDRVCLARDVNRPRAMEYINNLITDFIELHGDYLFSDDQAIVGGIGYFNDIPVTVIAQTKGRTIQDNIKRNFGSSNPEGFRKAKRLALQAEKFNRPIITIIDTSGAYPGRGAEERGQARAIAEDIMLFSNIKVPVISLVIGEGGSGGALALSVANKIYMLENAIYSILSPEGFSSILFKDSSKVVEVANKMKLTSYDLLEKIIVDEIIDEGIGDIRRNFNNIICEVKNKIDRDLEFYKDKSSTYIMNERYQKFRKIGEL